MQREGTWQSPLLHCFWSIFFLNETLTMQSSYLCCLVISVSTDISPSKLEQTPKLAVFGLHEYFAQKSRIRHSILTKIIYLNMVSAFWQLTSLRLQADSCRSRLLSTRSAFLHTLVLAHAVLHLLPGYPNSKELASGHCSILLIIPAKK